MSGGEVNGGLVSWDGDDAWVWCGLEAQEGRGVYFSMYSFPALPNSCAAPGPFDTPLVALIICVDVAIGSSLSLYMDFKLPGDIFSKPITMTQSAIP